MLVVSIFGFFSFCLVYDLINLHDIWNSCGPDKMWRDRITMRQQEMREQGVPVRRRQRLRRLERRGHLPDDTWQLQRGGVQVRNG